LSVADSHPEFGFAEKRAAGVFGGQPLKTPEGLFDLPFREEDLPFSEEGRIVRLRGSPGLSKDQTMSSDKEEENESQAWLSPSIPSGNRGE
jgi:hypothetical protein